MSLLEQGCQCHFCSKKTNNQLTDARDRWNNGEREVVFQDYNYEDIYGTDVFVNGFNLNCDGANIESVIERIMEFLDVKNVSIRTEYNSEE